MCRVFCIVLSFFISFSTLAIEIVPMDVAAFVDTAPQGPVNRAVFITSLEQFEKIYIGSSLKSRNKSSAYLQMKQYFLNGGTRAWFNRVLPPKDRPLMAKDLIGEPDSQTGIYVFTEEPNFSILVIPALNTLKEPEAKIAREASLAHAQSEKAFLLMDAPVTKDFIGLTNWRDNTPDLNGPLNSYGALYYPRIQVENTLIGPSGSIAGILAKTPVWISSSNKEILGVKKIESSIDSSQQADLNTNVVGINAIRDFPDYGIRLWGARSLNNESPDWRFIQTRRMTSMLERSISHGLKAYSRYTNTADTWVTVKASIQNSLHNLWLQGALVGVSAGEAYEVNVGLGSTMSPGDILEKRMIVSVRVALSRPDEFIELLFMQPMN